MTIRTSKGDVIDDTWNWDKLAPLRADAKVPDAVRNFYEAGTRFGQCLQFVFKSMQNIANNDLKMFKHID